MSLEYNVDENYSLERVKKEHPKYDIDIKNNAYWELIRNPSERDLNEVKELISKDREASVVWLTEPIEEDAKYDFLNCEAIVISNYLGKYDLVKVV